MIPRDRFGEGVTRVSELAGTTVMVTGAGNGIGRATARLFAERGAALVLLDLDERALESVRDECASLGASVHLRRVDITSSEDVAAMMQDVVRAVDRVHSLAHVAGIYPSANLVDMTDKMWHDVMTVNLTGTFIMCREVARHMLAQGGGSIVNVSSGASQTPLPMHSAYSASKGGVNAFSRTIAMELAPTVRVNVVAPGLTATRDHERENPHQVASVPLGRWGRPEEIAEGIAFLASDRASYITGQTLFVGGGRIMH